MKIKKDSNYIYIYIEECVFSKPNVLKQTAEKVPSDNFKTKP